MVYPSDEDLVAQVAELLTAAFWRMRRGAAKELTPFGLTFAQARVLRMIGRADGALRIGDLAMRLDVAPRSATSMVDVLEEARLVGRQADPDDRRSVLVGLSAAGNALIERMGEARRESAEALLGRLDQTQLAELRRLLEVLAAPEGPDAEGRVVS